jgi:hypothetical protein
MAHTQGFDPEELAAHVTEDSDLTPSEKETNIAFSKGGEKARVYSEEAGITRRLLQHDEFKIDVLRVNDGDTWGKRVPPEEFDGGDITGVRGYISVGVLKIQSNGRSENGHAPVVATP